MYCQEGTQTKGFDMDTINTDTIRYIIAFLAENEQYGDDWREEINELEKILDIVEGN